MNPTPEELGYTANAEEAKTIALITANLAECLNPEIIYDVILKEKRSLKVYWGTAPTGKPHCGYFVGAMKIAELLHAGCDVTVLLADIHAKLDSLKAPGDLVEHRTQYYKFITQALLRSLGVDLSRLHFRIGSSFQLSHGYSLDNMKLLANTKLSAAKKAGAEVVKQAADPTLGGLMYPGMQALDEEYLGVDAQLGGLDQRKIFTYATKMLPMIGYKMRAHLMHSMVPGLGQSLKMSSSEPESKIDLLDDPSAVSKKLKKAHCVPKEVEGNGVLAFLEHVVFRATALKTGSTPTFEVEMNGQTIVYNDIEKLKEDYSNDVCTPQALKSGLTKALNALLAPIRAEYLASEEWQKVSSLAYPVVQAEKVKKVKKEVDPARKAAALAAAGGASEGGKVEAATEGLGNLKVNGEAK
jgi:tyrosyl-tRNA synthetase